MSASRLLTLLLAALTSGLVTFVLIPPVSALARLCRADRAPADSLGLHTSPVPAFGGLAVYGGFASCLFFVRPDPALLSVLAGGGLLVLYGMLDDRFRFFPLLRLPVQLAAAAFAVWQGVRLSSVTLMGYELAFFDYGVIPATVVWLVLFPCALTLLDRLDGLVPGTVTVSTAFLTFLLLLQNSLRAAALTAVLCAVSFAFYCFEKAPARAWLGQGGAQFLGYALAVLSLTGEYKANLVISVLAPTLLFALPLFGFTFFRRLFKGDNPIRGARGHLHHRLLSIGLSMEDTVSVLLSYTALFSLIAFFYAQGALLRALFLLGALLISLLLTQIFVRSRKKKEKPAAAPAEEQKAD